ncbi:preprotein translocase subunit YajC [Streptomyces sp. NBC_01808]|uniref:preprotein translocase subunit YajC n=1 Tax=Streptomyces sp. NBC_01808 TaxID=2975947 RepID=UPI002DD8D803|nr:preprotein translocase subunit YajC [Streptomyces sp. NBC_01808]WSA36715.1 preprotein translocase subunit YajC [Streptomyces sp. NBC_01808]
MDITILLPFIVLIGAMFLMTRSAKNKQRQMMNMRDQLQPGSGVRTIGGMYATVKEVHEDTILLEVAPGVHAIYAKNSIGAVLDDAEYNRIVHGAPEFGDEDITAPDDASSLTGSADGDTGDEDAEDRKEASDRIDLDKKDAADDAESDAGAADTKDEDEKKNGGSAAK